MLRRLIRPTPDEPQPNRDDHRRDPDLDEAKARIHALESRCEETVCPLPMRMQAAASQRF